MKRFLGNLVLVTGSRVLDGAVRFITVPIVLGHFGRNDFGLMALAFSLHVFLTIAEFGVSANVVRRFSTLFVEGRLDEVRRLARVATSVYLGIGLCNVVLVLVLGTFGGSWFNLEPREAGIFFWMMLSLGVSSLFSWTFSVHRQLLQANSQVGYDEALNLVATAGTVLVLVATLALGLDVQTYFMLVLVPPLVPMLLRVRRCQRLVPGLGLRLAGEWSLFRPLVAGTLWLIVLSVADMAANHWRPVILAQLTGLEPVAEFRIVQQLAMAASLVLTGFMNVAYPAVARLDAADDRERLQRVLRYGSRLLLWAHVAVLVPIAFVAEPLLRLYVGAAYAHLALPLVLWLLSMVTYHYTIITSFVIARGRVRVLALSAAANAALSLLVAYLLAERWGTLGMVLSYSLYVLGQMVVLYLVALPAAGGGSGLALAARVLPRPLLAAMACAAAAVALPLWLGAPLWTGAPVFLLLYAAAALLGAVRSDLVELKSRPA